MVAKLPSSAYFEGKVSSLISQMLVRKPYSFGEYSQEVD
jgi:hypothetical protein